MIVVASLNLGPIPTCLPQKRSKRSNCSPANSVLSKLIPEANSIIHKGRRRCEWFDLYNELIPYGEAWSWQKSIVKERKALIERNEDWSDTLIILQHQPVYTLGTASSEEFLNFDIKDAPFDVYRTERGGEVTYHGPGQLVMYPIINLRYHKMDLHWYLRALEEVVILALSSAFSIKASRLEGLTGVWVGDQKLAAIGIRVSQWVAYHGLALNITADLTPFERIVPCGIRNRRVGSIKGLLMESLSLDGCGRVDIQCHDDCQLIDITHKSLVRAFCEVFQVELLQKSIPHQNFEWENCQPTLLGT